MAQSSHVPPLPAPWTQRLADTPPGSPLRLSLAIAAAGFAAFLAAEAALGRLALLASGEIHPRGDFRVALVMIAVVAYLPGAFAWVVRGARHTLDELAPVLRCSPAELAALRDAAGRFDRRSLRLAGAVGIALLLLIPLAANLTLQTWNPAGLPPEAIVHRLLLPVLGWFVGRFAYALIVESRRLSRIGRDLVRVDLLDLRPLESLARQGLRNAGASAGLLSLVALALVDVDIAPGLLGVLAAALSANALMSASVLLLPVRGLRAAVIAAKRTELDWCREEIRRARAGAPGARPLADVAAWRQLVEAAREWPFDAPTLLRFALYLAIPLGSWIGGAIVERLVDALL